MAIGKERDCRSELPKIRGVLNEKLMNVGVDAYVDVGRQR